MQSTLACSLFFKSTAAQSKIQKEALTGVEEANIESIRMIKLT